MNSKIQITRRRRWKRYKIRGGAIVLVHKPRIIDMGRSRMIELGPLIDISLGGLAVQYIENRKRVVESDELSVSIPAEGIKLDKIGFREVSDSIIADLPDGKRIRNRCVEFVDLNAHQKLQLETFIKQYAIQVQKDRRSGIDRRQFNDPRFEDEDYRLLYDRRSGKDRRIFTRH